MKKKKEKIANPKPKAVVVLGPTACGKTKLAVRLALEFNGEIISADSRQVYRYLNLGSGKDLADYQFFLKKGGRRRRVRVPYHLIDVVSPKIQFNLAQYQKLATQAFDDVLSRGRLPFLVGGSGLYLDAMIYNYQLPKNQKSAAAIKKYRQKLNQLSLSQLLTKLKKIDPDAYLVIDKKNRRRVTRALEIYYQTGQPKSKQINQRFPDYDFLVLGVKFPLSEIYQRIDQRLDARLRLGLIAEVKKLRQTGISWRRLDELGLEYRYISYYLRGRLDKQTMKNELRLAIHRFAKRQLTWFKRHPEIIWCENLSSSRQLIKRFLEN